MSQIPTVTLHNGLKMPILGFGVFQMDDEQAEQSVLAALEAGYRLIDTAASYGNEAAVGRAIKQSGIPRAELFITSKLWVKDATYEGAPKAYQTSLEKLQLEYLDLYLIHQPYNDIFGTWRALEELYEADAVKAIGVSNFTSVRLTDLAINNKIKPMVNQIEIHPFNQQVAARKVMDELGVVHEGWAPFAEGRQDLFTNQVLAGIAASHDVSVGQIVLRWHVQQGIIAIPKSVRPERIAENFAVFDFELSQDEMDKIAALDEKKGLFVNHDDPEFLKVLFSR